MKRKLNLQLCIEESELEVDKAIELVKSSDEVSVDAVVDQANAIITSDPANVDEKSADEATDSPPEKVDDADDAAVSDQEPAEAAVEDSETVAVEQMFKSVTGALKTVSALEQIAELIEKSEETGGLSEASIPVVKTAIESLYLDVSAPAIKMDTKLSLENLSTRLNVAKEFLSDIKDKILQIWQAIVATFKKIFSYLKEVWAGRKHQIDEDAAFLAKLRNAYRLAKDKLKDKPVKEDILGEQGAALVIDFKQGTYSDIVSSNKITLDVIDLFISENSRLAKGSLQTSEAIKKITSDFVTELDRALDLTETPNESAKIIDLISKDTIFEIPKTTPFLGKNVRNEVNISHSKEIAGGFVLEYTKPVKLQTPDVIDLVSLKIIDSEIKTAAIKLGGSLHSLFLPKKDELENLFDLTETTIKKSADMLKHLESLEKDFSELLKFAETIASKVKGRNNFASKSVNNFATHSKYFSAFTTACSTRYIKGAVNVDNYLYNYKKKLLQYTLISFKSYL